MYRQEAQQCVVRKRTGESRYRKRGVKIQVYRYTEEATETHKHTHTVKQLSNIKLQN